MNLRLGRHIRAREVALEDIGCSHILLELCRNRHLRLEHDRTVERAKVLSGHGGSEETGDLESEMEDCSERKDVRGGDH